MKPLTWEETRLKEQMKERCLAKGQYKDEKAKDKFEMLCHLEDFEVQYWELQQENKQLKEAINRAIEELKKGLHELDTRRREEVYVEEYIEESIDILEEVSRWIEKREY